MIKYTEQINELGIKTIVAEMDGFVSYIPTDLANSDYQAYLESLNDSKEL
jgi:hypothetical protein